MKRYKQIIDFIIKEYNLSSIVNEIKVFNLSEKHTKFWHDVFLINTKKKGKYILKIFRPERRIEHLRYEIKLINFLNKNILVPRVIDGRNGELIKKLKFKEKDRFAILYKYIEGEHLFNEKNDYINVGKKIFLFHTTSISDDLILKPQKKYDIYLDVPLLCKIGKKIFNQYNLNSDFLDKFQSYFCRSIDNLDFENDWGLIHGDLHNSNIIIDTSKKTHLIDFDMSGYCWKLYDLGVFNFFLIWHKRYSKISDDYLSFFLDGYFGENKINSRDKLYIDLFMISRFLRLFEYKNITKSQKSVKDHYFFLLKYISKINLSKLP